MPGVLALDCLCVCGFKWSTRVGGILPPVDFFVDHVGPVAYSGFYLGMVQLKKFL